MGHDWLINEIEGLRDYAAAHGLNALADLLDQARLLAMVELASRAEGADSGAGPEC